LNGADDLVAAFTVDGAPLRGRIARLGPESVDPILRRHEFPPAVAMLLGEALAFAALMGSLLKVEGHLSVQAGGDGPLALLVAEHRPDGALRGFAKLRPDAAAQLAGFHRASPAQLIGQGVLAVMLDLGETTHQGFVPLAGETLAQCAEAYFRESEQVETRVHLCVGEVFGPAAPCWRAGGVLMQKVAADQARGETEEGWRRSAIFLDTLTDTELLDPELPADRVLYRLFHEDGVRMAEPSPLVDRCSCDAERLGAIIQRFESIEDMIEPDGFIHARCEFCARAYRLSPPRA
jgi:molecular chaperone Hsp33